MSTGESNLHQRAKYWEKRRELQAKLEEARTALLDGKIPLAKRLFLDSADIERESQLMAADLKLAIPAAQVVATLGQSIQERYSAIVQGDLIDPATIRIQFQGIAEIEQALSGGAPAEADGIPAKIFSEKSRQAQKNEQFDRAEEYIKPILEQDRDNVDAHMQLAAVALGRARHAHAHDDIESSQRFINNASAIDARYQSAPGYSPQWDGFKDAIAEEQAATFFAAGSQSQQQWHLLRAHGYFQRVPAASSYGPQAKDRIRSLRFWAYTLLGVGIVVVLLLLWFRPGISSSVASSPTNTAVSAAVATTAGLLASSVPAPSAATAALSATAPATTQATQVTPNTATALPTESPTADPPTTVQPTVDQRETEAADQIAQTAEAQTATAETLAATVPATEIPTPTIQVQPPVPTKTRVPAPTPTRVPTLSMVVQKMPPSGQENPKCINVHIVFAGGYSGDGWTLLAEGLGITVPFNTGGYAALCVGQERQEFRFSILPPSGIRVTGNRSVPAQGGDNFEAYTRIR
jgi:hypothetical protein